MCLGVPGEIVEVTHDDLGMTMGRVRFGGITKEVCLAYVDEPKVGEFVLVHVGFALSRIDEAEAQRTLQVMEEMGELAELRAGEVDGPEKDGA